MSGALLIDVDSTIPTLVLIFKWIFHEIIRQGIWEVRT